MSDLEFNEKGPTVHEQKGRDFVALVKKGVSPHEAAKAVGSTLATLREKGKLAEAVRNLLERMAEEKLLDKKNAEIVARARLTELALQDEDLRVATSAAKAILGSVPAVAVQINNNHLKHDPEVLASLRELGIAEEEDAGTP